MHGYIIIVHTDGKRWRSALAVDILAAPYIENIVYIPTPLSLPSVYAQFVYRGVILARVMYFSRAGCHTDVKQFQTCALQ